jgi:hypothetical protein
MMGPRPPRARTAAAARTRTRTRTGTGTRGGGAHGNDMAHGARGRMEGAHNKPTPTGPQALGIWDLAVIA